MLVGPDPQEDKWSVPSQTTVDSPSKVGHYYFLSGATSNVQAPSQSLMCRLGTLQFLVKDFRINDFRSTQKGEL